MEMEFPVYRTLRRFVAMAFYIDKTAFIYQLVKMGNYYLLGSSDGKWRN